jgi:hypothetical protein
MYIYIYTYIFRLSIHIYFHIYVYIYNWFLLYTYHIHIHVPVYIFMHMYIIYIPLVMCVMSVCTKFRGVHIPEVCEYGVYGVHAWSKLRTLPYVRSVYIFVIMSSGM